MKHDHAASDEALTGKQLNALWAASVSVGC
jgi:hypothetical protein